MTAHPSDPVPSADDAQPEAPEPQAPDLQPEAAAEPEVEAAPEPEVEAAPEAAAEPEVEAAPEPEVDAGAGREPGAAEEAAAAQAAAGGKKKRKKKKPGAGAEGQPDGQAAAAPQSAAKPTGPDPREIVKRIGTTSEAALAYVRDPDPKLARMSRKHREAVITEVPPVTAAALLGPDALCRHFLASAATGRYQDLFWLWDLFVAFPEECKAVLASRQRAQTHARRKLEVATHLGLLGHADRVAADIDRAAGLPWRWLKEILEPLGHAIRRRPAVLAALLRRQPDWPVELPAQPDDRWLAEAAALRDSGAEVPESIAQLLGANVDRLPATVATLSMAQVDYPDRVPALLDRVDLDARDIAAILRWARDHGHGDRLTARISARVEEAAAGDRAAGLAAWKAWQARGVEIALPESLLTPTLEGLDLGRPESAELVKVLVDRGADLDPQRILDDVAAASRPVGEKAYEAFVSAGFDDVHLPIVLEGNPMVRPETRCPACQAWTWVRPGLEKRCPREGCPLRARADAPAALQAEDAGEQVDAAIAALDEGAVVAAEPAPAVSTGERPAAAPPADRPAPPPPAEPAPAGDAAWADAAEAEDAAAPAAAADVAPDLAGDLPPQDPAPVTHGDALLEEATEASAQDGSADEQASADQASGEQPAAEQASAEQPAAEQASEDAVADPSPGA